MANAVGVHVAELPVGSVARIGGAALPTGGQRGACRCRTGRRQLLLTLLQLQQLLLLLLLLGGQVLCAGVGAGNAVVGATASALQRVAAIHHALARNGKVTQSVVLLLDASVGHGGDPKENKMFTHPFGHLAGCGRSALTEISAGADIADLGGPRRGCPASLPTASGCDVVSHSCNCQKIKKIVSN